MKAHRPRQVDQQKPFILYTRTEDFERIEHNEGDLQHSQIEPPSVSIVTPSAVVQKEPIVAPKIGINTLQESQYINNLCLTQQPDPEIYELTDQDIEYLSTHNRTLRALHLDELQKQQLANLIVLFEIRSGKEVIVEFNTVKNEIPPNIHRPEEIYKYWKSQRDHLKRPLIRKLQKASPDDTNPHIAFRPREKEKMKLRRTLRPSGLEQDINSLEKFKQLKWEFDLTEELFQGIQSREKIKEHQSMIKFVEFLDKVAKYESIDFDQIEPVLRKKFKSFEQAVENLNTQCSQCHNNVEQFITHSTNTLSQIKPVLASMYQSANVTQKTTKYVQKQQSFPLTSETEKLKLPTAISQEEEDQNYSLACFMTSTAEAVRKYHQENNTGYYQQEMHVQQPSKVDKEKEMVEEPVVQKEKKNPNSSLPFSISYRVGRQNRIFIDRFLSEEEYYPSYDNIFIVGRESENLENISQPFVNHQLFRDRSKQILSGMLVDLNESDGENEDTLNEELKSIRKNFKNFKKEYTQQVNK